MCDCTAMGRSRCAAIHVTLITSVVIPFPRLWTHVRLAAELHRRPPDLFLHRRVIPASYRGPAVATVHDLGYLLFRKCIRVVSGCISIGAHATMCAAVVSFWLIHATRDDVVRLMAASPEKVAVVYPGKRSDIATCDGFGRNQPCLHPLRHHPTLLPAYRHHSATQKSDTLDHRFRSKIAAHIPHHLVLAGKAGWMADPSATPWINCPRRCVNGLF